MLANDALVVDEEELTDSRPGRLLRRSRQPTPVAASNDTPRHFVDRPLATSSQLPSTASKALLVVDTDTGFNATPCSPSGSAKRAGLAGMAIE